MEKEIDLKELFSVIKKRLWLLIIITLLCSAAGYFYKNYNHKPFMYQYSSRVIISSAHTDLMQTLQVMIKDPNVLEQVAEKLHLNRSLNALAGQITANNLNSSQIVNISVIDTDPKLAVKIANTTASIFQHEAATVLNFGNIRLLSVSNEKETITLIDPNHHHITLTASIIGLVLGMGLIFLLDSLDDTIKTEREIEQSLGAPVLGIVSRMTKKNMKKKIQLEKELRGETIGIN